MANDYVLLIKGYMYLVISIYGSIGNSLYIFTYIKEAYFKATPYNVESTGKFSFIIFTFPYIYVW